MLEKGHSREAVLMLEKHTQGRNVPRAEICLGPSCGAGGGQTERRVGQNIPRAASASSAAVSSMKRIKVPLPGGGALQLGYNFWRHGYADGSTRYVWKPFLILDPPWGQTCGK
jgi:hypothetical protein